MELKGSGLFGDAENPRVRRNVLELIDLGGIEQEVDPEYADAERARLENLQASRGEPLLPPMPWHKDPVHIEFHEEQMNSPEFDGWAPERKEQLVRHYIWHLRKPDPARAFEIASMFGFDDLAQIMQPPAPEAPAGPPQDAGMPPGMPPPEGMPPAMGAPDQGMPPGMPEPLPGIPPDAAPAMTA